MMRHRQHPKPWTRDCVAYTVAGYRSLFPELDFAEPELRSLQALRHKMITLAETYQRERQAGEREGRQQTLSEYVRLFWDEATSQGLSSALVRAGCRSLAFAPRFACGLSGRA